MLSFQNRREFRIPQEGKIGHRKLREKELECSMQKWKIWLVVGWLSVMVVIFFASLF